MNTIYALVDPRNSEIRYVGVTRQVLKARLQAHIRGCETERHTRKIAWIKSLIALGMKPTITALEETDDRSRECFWISKLRAEGIDLTNGTGGGDGGSPMLGRNHSTEARARISIAHKTSARALAAREKHFKSLVGHSVSEATRRKISSALTGRKFGPYPPERCQALKDAWARRRSKSGEKQNEC